MRRNQYFGFNLSFPRQLIDSRRGSRGIHVRVILTCALSVGAAVSNAAPILVAEFRHNPDAKLYFFSPPATVPFDFGASSSMGGLQIFSWEDDYGPSDVGMTFQAPQDVVDDANLSIDLPNTEFFLTSGPANFSAPLRLTMPPSCGPDGCVQVFEPELSQYRITSVERIIDQLEQTPLIDGHLLDAGQRIRYWGELIPEPTTIAMIVLAFMIKISVR